MLLERLREIPEILKSIYFQQQHVQQLLLIPCSGRGRIKAGAERVLSSGMSVVVGAYIYLFIYYRSSGECK